MASGFGLDCGRGRCFHFWQEFNKCYASIDLPQQCLHHTKEFAPITRIKTEELKQAEFRQKQKKDALTAANSNMQKLNIFEEKVA
ncbi:hypothetical protein G6F46_008008 [Rhizopus delemar]|uniref:Uncharacterized protein n=2 Tax=Rhizopus TaxID=4842 RepID=A0A9P7CMI3_9FUNG|nr:hypothetical protein G6F55_006952 [Rhizopus delemar]KAG1540738.1 hypothetical protein G6F51_008341 [Rhizopus arrhizus]KAG1494965.1 hypothetical protein G6F54_007506 [Rhizopus delemar]KAG1508966.1 hypothetical protein G6F53_007798 [Rhizopus delemar]KAG1524567.1 hypothetical protein G6F52_004082 [Rhizopus delemar]